MVTAWNMRDWKWRRGLLGAQKMVWGGEFQLRQRIVAGEGKSVGGYPSLGGHCSEYFLILEKEETSC